MKKLSNTKKILKAVRILPYFEINDLKTLGLGKYLKIYLSRLIATNKLVPLKKGVYVARDYLDECEKKGLLEDYLLFLGNVLYSPSYLSLEYLLAKENILSEDIWNFTFVTKNKTKILKNNFGLFVYHHLKKELFIGWKIVRKGDFFIFTASKAKALFDFLYLRRNDLINKEAVKESRLNLEEFSKKEFKELEKYVQKEGSLKMKEIFKLLLLQKWKK